MENKDNKPSPKSHKAEEADKDKLLDSLNYPSEDIYNEGHKEGDIKLILAKRKYLLK
jgi:hypothetical protein